MPALEKSTLIGTLIGVINGAARKTPAWVIYALGFALAGWMIFAALTGLSGPDPVKALERGLGEKGLQILIAALCITPLRWVGINLIKFRRAIGLMAFMFVVLHFTAWIVLDMALRWSEIVTDLTKRPYILVGLAALIVLIPLAVTSNQKSIKRMGAAGWKRLHWLAYPATLAGAVHFVMIGKVYTVESALYVATVLALLAARWIKNHQRVAKTT
ncbi:MAG: protein-methionine-sulfoxide reductase heme-binding subunit MsrQ [Microgenomates group bacterium]